MSRLLDHFNRADNTDPGDPPWIQQIHSGAPQSHDIVSNQLKSATSGFCSDYWMETFPRDQEIYCTIIAMPTTGAFRLYGRLASPHTANPTGYELEIDSSNSYLSRVDSPNLTRVLLTVVGVTFANGDGIKLQCNGNLISAWRDTGSGYTMVGSTTDSTYANSGFVGVWSQNDTGVIVDDMFGGAIGGESFVRETMVAHSRGTSW